MGSQVLAAGHCRLLLDDRVLELDAPVLEAPAEVPDLARPVRALFTWLGFRYLRLRTSGDTHSAGAISKIERTPIERVAVSA